MVWQLTIKIFKDVFLRDTPHILVSSLYFELHPLGTSQWILCLPGLWYGVRPWSRIYPVCNGLLPRKRLVLIWNPTFCSNGLVFLASCHWAFCELPMPDSWDNVDAFVYMCVCVCVYGFVRKPRPGDSTQNPCQTMTATLDTYENAWALTHLPRPMLLKFLRPNILSPCVMNWHTQWIWFYYYDSLLYMHNITFHDFMHTRTNFAHARAQKLLYARVWNSRHTLFTRDCDYTPNAQVKLPEITFFDLVTLTFDLWPWPSNSFEILSKYTAVPNIGSVGPMVQSWERRQTHTRTHTHTHRQTDETDSITSTAYAGGKNVSWFDPVPSS